MSSDNAARATSAEVELRVKEEVKEVMEVKEEIQVSKESQIVNIAKPNNVVCEIAATHDNLMAERERMFYELADSDGSVTLRCPLSGLSYRAKNISEWPKFNMRVPTKKIDAYFVKFTVLRK
jgi:hypothetical protein